MIRRRRRGTKENDDDDDDDILKRVFGHGTGASSNARELAGRHNNNNTYL